MLTAHACGTQYQRTTPGLAVPFLCQPSRHGVARGGEAARRTQARHVPGANTKDGQLMDGWTFMDLCIEDRVLTK